MSNSNQRALNFALTMVPRNVTTGGFLERLLLDAQLPGSWEVDAEGKQTGRFIAAPHQAGAGTINYVEGARYEETNEQGDKVIRHGSPSAVFREPVKPDASLTARDAHYRAIVDEVGQTHVLISADATTSARSRIESRLEYLSTLQLTQGEAEAAIRFLVETALAMAEAIAGKPGEYTGALRCQASCKLDTGTVSPEERKAIESSIGVTLSQDTAMILLGIDDIEAEKARIANDPMSRAAYAKAIGEALTALTTPGASLEGAAKFLKLPKEEVDALMTPATFESEPPAATTPNPSAPPPTNGDQPPEGKSGKGAKQGTTTGSQAGGQPAAAA